MWAQLDKPEAFVKSNGVIVFRFRDDSQTAGKLCRFVSQTEGIFQEQLSNSLSFQGSIDGKSPEQVKWKERVFDPNETSCILCLK